MKKLSLVLGLAGVLAVPTLQAGLVFDGTLTLAGGPYQFGQGGEFAVTSTPSGANFNFGNFQTFCTEYNENNVLNSTPYDYKQNIGSVQGGGPLNGATSLDPYTGLSMDIISKGTAYLYSEFRKGTVGALNNPTYFSGGYFNGNRQSHAGELQNAIWALENESAGSISANIIAILNAAGLTALNWGDPSGGAYGVVSLNLYNGADYKNVTAPDGTNYKVNQDVLAIVPEPTTMIAGALLLLPFAASTIRMLRRKA